MAFFVLDLETLGVESTSVVLSAAFVYVDPDDLSTDNLTAYQQLLDGAAFAKFDAKEQRSMGRTVDADTLNWWKKQGDVQKRTSLLPGDNDMTVIEGLDSLCDWYQKFPNWKTLPVWVRGSLDQPCFESLFRSVGKSPIVPYNCYRDVRTAIDLLYPNSKAGYVDIPDFDQYTVIKHDPVHDCAYDALMMLRGTR